MEKIIIISAVLAISAAAPALLIEHKPDIIYHTPVIPVVHQLSSAKSTLTKSHQVVDHGSTSVLHTPVIPVVHHLSSAKSTLTKSHQVVDHGSTSVVHAPVIPHVYHVSTAKMYVHTVPSSVLIHAPVYKDSAVSHHSSSVHETVPVVNHLPLYTLHH